MNKILVSMLALAANLSSFAQTDVEMGEIFTLSGKSITIFKTENANGAKLSVHYNQPVLDIKIPPAKE